MSYPLAIDPVLQLAQQAAARLCVTTRTALHHGAGAFRDGHADGGEARGLVGALGLEGPLREALGLLDQLVRRRLSLLAVAVGRIFGVIELFVIGAAFFCAAIAAVAYVRLRRPLVSANRWVHPAVLVAGDVSRPGQDVIGPDPKLARVAARRGHRGEAGRRTEAD
mgnify:CR=1 FL=1